MERRKEKGTVHVPDAIDVSRKKDADNVDNARAKLDKRDLGKGSRFADARGSRSAMYTRRRTIAGLKIGLKNTVGEGAGTITRRAGNGKARTRQRGESLFPRSGGYGLRAVRSGAPVAGCWLHYECVHISCVASFLPLSVFPTLPRALLFALFRLLMPRN